MRIFIDDDTNELTTAAGVAQELRQITCRLNDTETIEVQFYRGNTIIERAPGATGKLAFKEAGKYSDDAIVQASSWVKTGSGSTAVYTFSPVFSGTPLTTLLGTKKYVDLIFEIEWTEGGSKSSTRPAGTEEVIGRIWNDINKDGDTPPDPGPEPYPSTDLLIHHYSDVTGWSGAGGLSTVPSIGISTNRLVAFLIDGKPFHAMLIESTHATDVSTNPIYQRPDDYDAETNARVWISWEIQSPSESPVGVRVADFTALIALATTGMDAGTTVLVEGKGLYTVIAENIDTAAPWVYKPTDFDGDDNIKVFAKVLSSVEAAPSVSALMGGESTDLDSVPTVPMSEGQVLIVAGAPQVASYRLEAKTFVSANILSVSSNRIYTAGTLPPLNSVVEFFSTDTLPTGLTEGEFLYVVAVDDGSNYFQVSSTHRGTPQAITSSGTGTHSFTVHEDPWWIRPRDHSDSGMAWRLIGPEQTLTFQVFRNQEPVVAGRQYAGFAPVTMLPHRVQFDLAALGSSSTVAGLESDSVEIIAGGSMTIDGRSVDTDEAEETVEGRLFRGDEIIVDVSAAGGAKGLIVHVSGIVAPLVGMTIGNGSTDEEIGDIIAVAGPDQSVTEGGLVTLDASGSTANTGDITYSWARISGPSISLSSSTSAQPTFVAPSVDADTPIVIRLTVTNTVTSQTDTDDVTITVLNFGLTAVAGIDQTVTTGTLVTLDSTGSTSLSTGIVEYEWEQIWGPAVTLSNPNAAQPTFTAPVDARAYSFRLHVTNRTNGAVATDDVVINVIDSTAYLVFSPDKTPICVDANDARILVGCDDGVLYTSDDNIEFFKINSGFDTYINDVANRAGDGKAVFVSADGIYYSANGVNWSEVVDQYGSRSWTCVADSGTSFVALANDGYYGRSLNGTSWTVALLQAGMQWQGIATDGDSKWIALGTAGYIWYSSNDGVTWSQTDLGSMTLTGAAYSPSLNRWVMCGGSYLGYFAGASFGAGIPAGITAVSGVTNTFYDVAWDSVNSVFLAVGFNCASKSYDGINWTSVYADLGTPGSVKRVASRSGRFVLPSTTLGDIIVAPAMPD